MNQLTELDKAYLAGFFDGEGCVSITKQRGGKRSKSPSYNMRAIISQAGKGVGLLEYWNAIVGVGVLHSNKHAAKNWSTSVNWVISSDEALEFLTCIYPYLHRKKEEAELAIEFQSKKKSVTFDGKAYGGPGNNGGLDTSIIEERERIYQQLSAMKGHYTKRGRPAK